MSHAIRFGRTDGSANKRIVDRSRIRALALANALSYVFFHKHEFKASQFKPGIRVEREGFYIEYTEVDENGIR